MTTLGDLCLPGGIQTGPFGSQLHADEYSPHGVPVVMPQDIGDNRIETVSIARVPEVVADRLNRHRLQEGDIVYSRRGDVERRAWVPSYQQGWLCGTGCLRVRVNPTVAWSRFVSYFLGTPETRAWIVSHAVGATMLNLNTSILAEVPVQVPDLPTQRAIAEVLGALDDKIAANDTVARTSENLLSAKFAALRADVDAELVPLGELLELNPRCAPLTEPEPVYVDMQKLPTVGSQIADWGWREARGGARFMNGDTLLARITPCLENRKVGYVDFLAPGQTGIGSTEFIVLRSRPGLARPLSFLLAVDEGFRSHAVQHMIGSSGRQRVAASDLTTYQFRLPCDRRAFQRLGDTATAVFELLARQRNETRQLVDLRDTLLPHLMSGRISVRDAEQAVEGVL